MRTAAKRIVQTAWLLTLGGCVFSVIHAGDRDPHQWDAAMFFTMALMAALLLSAIYSWFVVPLTRRPD